MKTGMAADYVATSSDHIVRVERLANNLWVEIDGLRIQIVRDGTDAEPEISVDVWAGETLDAGRGNPLATVSVDATTMQAKAKIWPQ